MTKKTVRSEITVKMDGFADPYVTNVVQSIKPTIHPIINEDSIHFELDVKCVVEGVESEDQEIMEKLIKKVEETMEKEIETTYKAALKMDVDVFRLSETVYRKHNKAWKKMNEDGVIPLDENSIRSINVEVVKMNGERVISNRKDSQ